MMHVNSRELFACKYTLWYSGMPFSSTLACNHQCRSIGSGGRRFHASAGDSDTFSWRPSMQELADRFQFAANLKTMGLMYVCSRPTEMHGNTRQLRTAWAALCGSVICRAHNPTQPHAHGENAFPTPTSQALAGSVLPLKDAKGGSDQAAALFRQQLDHL
jgi:hypothetical protein